MLKTKFIMNQALHFLDNFKFDLQIVFTDLTTHVFTTLSIINFHFG